MKSLHEELVEVSKYAAAAGVLAGVATVFGANAAPSVQEDTQTKIVAQESQSSTNPFESGVAFGGLVFVCATIAGSGAVVARHTRESSHQSPQPVAGDSAS